MQGEEVTSKWPVRLDLNTKVSIMAAIIFGLSDIPTEKAVDAAVALEQAVTKRVAALKAESRARREIETAR